MFIVFKMSNLVPLFMYLLVKLFLAAEAGQVADFVYNDMNATGACFRRFNTFGQIGCNSGRKGNAGVVHYIQNETDLYWLVERGPHKPYVALLTPVMFNKETLDALERSDKINAILVIKTDDYDIPDEFSPDDSCPNHRFDMYADDDDYRDCRNQTWNTAGSALFFEDHGFPIITVTNRTKVRGLVEDCYEKHNAPTADGSPRDYPLCAAEVKAAMDGAVDSETCLRRSNMITNLNPQVYCDHMGDYNVFGLLPASVHNNSQSYADGEIIVVSARLDSFSMFDNHYPSADSAVSGIVTLLAVAETLGRYRDSFNSSHRPVMFLFFNGEAFDYMGSQRLLYDMKHGDFPYSGYKSADRDQVLRKVRPNHLGHYIELSQLGKSASQPGGLYMHTNPRSMENGTISDQVLALMTMLENYATEAQLTLERTPDTQPLPPASVQTFLAETDFPAVVIGDHQSAYTNTYYNSMYDELANINATYPNHTAHPYNYVTPAAEQLARVATVTSRAIYELATGLTAPENLTANETVMANLLYCFLVNPHDCELFQQVLSDKDSEAFAKSDHVVWSYYVGVFSVSRNWVTHLVYNVLARYLAVEELHINHEECQKKNDKRYLHTYTYMSGTCVKATVNTTYAVSPVYDQISDYDWSSKKYPVWTESRWANDAIGVRYFLVPALWFEVVTLLVGVVMLCLSLLLCRCCGQRASRLFPDPDSSLSAEPSALTAAQPAPNPRI